jgi:hypothetical protein
MVKSTSGKKEGLRSFKVVDVRKHSGCETKFRSGRFISRTPVGAARKAFNDLCRVKKIRGVCTLHVVVKDTTKGSKGKEYCYKLQRRKLKQPLVMMKGTNNQYTIEYSVDAKSVSMEEMEKCKRKGKTSGVMARRSKRLALKARKEGENKLRKSKKN